LLPNLKTPTITSSGVLQQNQPSISIMSSTLSSALSPNLQIQMKPSLSTGTDVINSPKKLSSPPLNLPNCFEFLISKRHTKFGNVYTMNMVKSRGLNVLNSMLNSEYE